MSERAYNMKSALPNKVLDEDGNITDLFGNPVVATSEAYRNKPSLPNKWLNPDGTYSTLTEIIAGAIDTDVFVIVDELPEEGNPKKIYLVPDDEGGFIEYHYVDGNWDPIGTVEIDLSNYWTISQVQQAIANALQASKDYADAGDATMLQSARTYTDNAIASFVPLRAFPSSVVTDQSTTAFFNSIKALNLATGSMMLGLVELTDMPTGLIQAEVRVEVYDNNVVYGVMRSADLAPYVWEANSYDYHGWEQEGQTILDQAENYSDTNFLKKNNTTAYTPSENYHPATKKYVDDAISTSVTSALNESY